MEGRQIQYSPQYSPTFSKQGYNNIKTKQKNKEHVCRHELPVHIHERLVVEHAHKFSQKEPIADMILNQKMYPSFCFHHLFSLMDISSANTVSVSIAKGTM